VRRAAFLFALVGLAGAMIARAGATSDADGIAALVGPEQLTVAAVDARCGDPCARLQDDIRRRTWEALQALVDEALLEGAPEPAVQLVSDADVEAYRIDHAQDFDGSPARDRAAIRFFLTRERRQRAEQELVRGERQRRPAKLLVAAGDRTLGDSTAERVLAEAGTRRITNRDVEERLALVLYRLRGALYRERLRHIETLIDEAVWSSTAAEAGTSTQELRAAVTAAASPVTDEDLERYFETEVRSRNPQAEKRLDRLRPYLEFQRIREAEARFVANGRARLAPRVLLEAPVPPRLALEAGPGGWRGAPGAPVRVVFLTSYRGDTSRAMWPVVKRLASEPGTALTVRPLLPQWDPEATAVAGAVYCAAAESRAWELHELAAAHATLPDAATLLEMAVRVGLARGPFERCLAEPATSEAVVASSAEAERLGLTEPPVTVIGGLVFGGMQRTERLRAAVRESLSVETGRR